jgi:hypothetical protein
MGLRVRVGWLLALPACVNGNGGGSWALLHSWSLETGHRLAANRSQLQDADLRSHP